MAGKGGEVVVLRNILSLVFYGASILCYAAAIGFSLGMLNPVPLFLVIVPAVIFRRLGDIASPEK